MDALPEMMAYRWRRVIPRGEVGQRGNTRCPRCGAAGAYHFAGRYKVCAACGLSTQFERDIRAYRSYARRDRLAEAPLALLLNLKLLCQYIRAWAVYKQAHEVR